MAETTEGESTPRILVPALEGGRNLIDLTEQQAPAVHTAPSGYGRSQRKHTVLRTSLPYQGEVENMLH